MADVKTFIMWFLSELPDFLMSEPICYFMGFAILTCVVGLFKRMINL